MSQPRATSPASWRLRALPRSIGWRGAPEGRADDDPSRLGQNTHVILTPLAVYSLARAADGGVDDRALLAGFGIACLAGAGMGLVIARTALRAPWRDARPTPRPILWSFAIFVVLLLIVSSLLLARVSVLPWPVTSDQSTAIGLMFLGAAAYFAYGLVQPCWKNAGGQLAGFLAYDLVLIGPFLKRLPDVPAEFQVELSSHRRLCRPDEPHCFSGDQLPRLARATRASELGSPLPIVAARTGPRPEEWLGIARRDVDRVRGVLHVRHVDVDGQVKLTGRRPGWCRGSCR